MSFRLSFHLALLGATGAYWLDDLSDVSCKDSTRPYAVDGPLLSCKQQVGGSSPPASSQNRAPVSAGQLAAAAGLSASYARALIAQFQARPPATVEQTGRRPSQPTRTRRPPYDHHAIGRPGRRQPPGLRPGTRLDGPSAPASRRPSGRDRGRLRQRPRSRRLNLGHFAAGRWQLTNPDAPTDRAEVLVSSEGLQRGPVDVLGTLLHEAAHGLAHARKIGDTSRQGRSHNRRYATLAGEFGLDAAHVQPIGWSATSVPEPTAARYVEVLAELAAALVLWRRAERASPAGPGRSRSALACSCACGRRIRVAHSVLELAPILCGACAQPFEPEDDEPG
jgi:hypothetical protein